MRIAVASGKGGTGKTTLATSLALTLAAPGNLAAESPPPPLFLDCDVEAPNAHLFLRPALDQQAVVNLLAPEVDQQRCTHCKRCGEVCQYHAIADLDLVTIVFPQLCHGCGSCTLVCPEQAIREISHRLGILEAGPARQGIWFAHGILDVGAPLAVPVIRQLQAWVTPQPGQTVIVDCPPGTSCPVVASLKGAEVVLLVTEPTPFGLHDLRLALQVTRELGLPAGVVVNR